MHRWKDKRGRSELWVDEEKWCRIEHRHPWFKVRFLTGSTPPIRRIGSLTQAKIQAERWMYDQRKNRDLQ